MLCVDLFENKGESHSSYVTQKLPGHYDTRMTTMTRMNDHGDTCGDHGDKYDDHSDTYIGFSDTYT